MKLDYWTFGCRTNGTSALHPVDLPGPGGPMCGPAVLEAGRLPQQEGPELPGCG